MTVSGKVSIVTTLNEGKALDLAQASVPVLRTYETVIANGTAAGQADRIFHDRRTIAPSSNDDLDLAGVLTDSFGATITFVKIKGLLVSAAAANTNNVIIGGSASNPFATFLTGTTPGIVVRPGMTFAMFAGQADAAGFAVTAATADILRLTNSGAGTSTDYDIIIFGTSA